MKPLESRASQPVGALMSLGYGIRHRHINHSQRQRYVMDSRSAEQARSRDSSKRRLRSQEARYSIYLCHPELQECRAGITSDLARTGWTDESRGRGRYAHASVNHRRSEASTNQADFALQVSHPVHLGLTACWQHFIRGVVSPILTSLHCGKFTPTSSFARRLKKPAY